MRVEYMKRLFTLVAAVGVFVGVRGFCAGEELTLSDFESTDSLKMLENAAKIELVAEHATQGTKAGKVPAGFTIVSGTWKRMPADWSGYDELRLDIFNPGAPARVSLWIADKGGSDYWKRHNNVFTLKTGENTLIIPVGGLWRGEKGSGEFLDTKDLAQIVISLPKEGDAYYIDNMRLVKGAGDVQTTLLIGFEAGETPKARWNIEDYPQAEPGKSKAEPVEDHATEGKRALKIDYRPAGSAIVITGVPADWSGFDSLEIDCFNAADRSITISGWIRDKDAEADGGYWKRHNYKMNVAAGTSVIRFPIGGLWRGEKGATEVLDKRNMSSMCISAKGVTLYFDNVRLVKGAQEVQVEGLRKFDFGPASAPNFPGFDAVHEDTLYNAQRGYGWVNAQSSRDPRNYEQPDSLLCDFIRVNSGQVFAVDVPNGEYVAHIMLEMPGMWDYMRFRDRTLRAEGKEVVRETVSSDDFLKDRFFRFEDAEDLPGCDIWKKYVEATFRPKTFTVTVADGQLNLQFLGDTWGLTPSYLVIYPTSQKEAGEKWFAQMNERRREAFYTAYAEVVRKADPKPETSAEETAQGFVLFSRGIDKEISYNSAPGNDPSDTREPKMDVAAVPGEYESFSLSIYPLKDCGDLTLKAGELKGADGKTIPASAFRQRAIRYKFKRIGGRITSSFQYEPWLLIDFDKWPIQKDVTRRFWLTLKVPEDAAPGKYSGSVDVTLAGKTHTIPVSLEVYPFRLDEPTMSIGMFGGSRSDGGGYWDADLMDRFQWDRRTEEVLRDQKDHGMTAVTPIRPKFNGIRDGKASFDYAEMDRYMALLRKIGYTHECFTYAGMFRVREGDVEAQARRDYNMPLEQAIRLTYEELGRHAKEANWLPMAWALADEPLIHGIKPEMVIKVFEAHRKAAPQMQFVIEDAMGDPEHYVVIPACDIVCGNTPRYAVAQAVKKNKARYWFNNIGTDRFIFGWYLWKAKEDMGVEALFQWGYSTNKADIYYDLDGSEGDSGVAFTSSKGQRARREWELIREGADDHRYLQTLDNLIRNAEKDGPAPAKAKAAEARNFVKDVMSKINLEDKRRRAYAQADLDNLKRQLAAYIIALQDSLK